MDKTPTIIYAVMGYGENGYNEEIQEILGAYSSKEDAEILLAYLTTDMQNLVTNPKMCYNGWSNVAVVEIDVDTEYAHLEKRYVFTFAFLLCKDEDDKVIGYKHCGPNSTSVRITSYRDLKNIGDFYLNHYVGTFHRKINNYDISVEVLHTNNYDAFDIADLAVKNFLAKLTE